MCEQTLRLTLCCTQEQTQVQEQTLLPPIGGCTKSVFLACEKWLSGSKRRQQSFCRFVPKNALSYYQSLMDCLFCEIFTSYRQPCDDFYMGYGPPLKGMRSAAEIREFDGVLLRKVTKGS